MVMTLRNRTIRVDGGGDRRSLDAAASCHRGVDPSAVLAGACGSDAFCVPASRLRGARAFETAQGGECQDRCRGDARSWSGHARRAPAASLSLVRHTGRLPVLLRGGLPGRGRVVRALAVRALRRRSYPQGVARRIAGFCPSGREACTWLSAGPGVLLGLAAAVAPGLRCCDGSGTVFPGVASACP